MMATEHFLHTSTEHFPVYFTSTTIMRDKDSITPILQIKKLRHREVQSVV